MSPDTAFALGLAGAHRPPFPDRVRACRLAVVVVETSLRLSSLRPYTETVRVLCHSLGCRLLRCRPVVPHKSLPVWAHYLVLGAVHGSSCQGRVEADRRRPGNGPPCLRYPAPRSISERATERFRGSANNPLRTSAPLAGWSSIGDLAERRLQRLCHPWTSYVIVPLLRCERGIALDSAFWREPSVADHARDPVRVCRR